MGGRRANRRRIEPSETWPSTSDIGGVPAFASSYESGQIDREAYEKAEQAATAGPPARPSRTLVAALRAERERQGLSLADIADGTGMDRAAIHKLEIGVSREPDPGHAQPICRGPRRPGRMVAQGRGREGIGPGMSLPVLRRVRPSKVRISPNVGSLDDPRAFGQRLQEGAAIRLGEDARVEDHDDAAVGFGADQPAEALLELDHSLGDLVVDERVAAAAADVLEPGLQQRVARDANGRRVMITFESASPGTSTPCQKLSTPKITLLTSALKASTILDRGMPSDCENRAMFRRASQGVRARWPPRASCTR